MTKIEAEELWGEVAQWSGRGLKVSGAIGFLVSVTYFLRIGSFPVDNVTGVLSLGSVIALISIGSFFVMVLYWTLPTLVFHALIDQIGDPGKGWFMSPRGARSVASLDDNAAAGLPYSQEFPGSASGQALKNGSAPDEVGVASEKKQSVSWDTGDRNLASWCFVTVALPWTASFAWFVEAKYETLKHASEIAATVSLVFAMWVIGSYALSRAPDEPKAGLVRKRLGVAAIVLVLNTFPLFIFLSSLDASDFADKLSDSKVTALLAGGIVLTALAQFLALTGSIKEKTAGVKAHAGQLVVSTVLIVWGLFWLSAWSHVEDNVMTVASVRIPSVKLAIAKPGCQALASLGLARVLPASGPSSYENGCSLAPVVVLSRVGSRWLVKCLEADRDATVEPISLKGDDVLNFLAVDPPPKLDKPAGSNSASQPIAKTFGSCRAVASQEALGAPVAASAAPIAAPASAASGSD